MNLQELIHYIVCAIVDSPEDVSISVIEGGQISVLELTVAKDDLGKVIGKQGRNAQAIRTILNSVSAKIRKRVVLEIIE